MLLDPINLIWDFFNEIYTQISIRFVRLILKENKKQRRRLRILAARKPAFVRFKQFIDIRSLKNELQHFEYWWQTELYPQNYLPENIFKEFYWDSFSWEDPYTHDVWYDYYRMANILNIVYWRRIKYIKKFIRKYIFNYYKIVVINHLNYLLKALIFFIVHYILLNLFVYLSFFINIIII